MRQYVFRVISIYGVGIGAVKYIGRSVLSVIVGGWAPTDFPISFGLFFDAELRGGGWRNIVYPRHGRLQGGSGVVAFFKNVIKFLRIVHEVLHTVVTFACQTMCTGEVYLPLYFVYRPVAFIGVEEVDAQSGNNLPSVTLFLPVECKRVEAVATEIHHRVDLVLYAFAQPALYILIDGVESIPAARRITGCIAVLAYGAGADLYPGLQCFDAFIEITDDFRDIIPPPLCKVSSVAVFFIGIAVGEAQGVFGIAQVIEVYAVYIVMFHDFTDKAHQVFFGLRMSGIEEIFTFIGHTDSRFTFGDRLLAESGDMPAIT